MELELVLIGDHGGTICHYWATEPFRRIEHAGRWYRLAGRDTHGAYIFTAEPVAA